MHQFRSDQLGDQSSKMAGAWPQKLTAAGCQAVPDELFSSTARSEVALFSYSLLDSLRASTKFATPSGFATFRFTAVDRYNYSMAIFVITRIELTTLIRWSVFLAICWNCRAADARQVTAAELQANPSAAAAGTTAPLAAGEDIDRLLTDLVLSVIPHSFEDTKQWGLQEEKRTLLPRLRRDDDGGLETHRPRELVNHGDWHRVKVTLSNPQEQFTVQLKNIRAGAPGELLFDVACRSALDLEGRHAKWSRGVQLYSIGVEGRADVELNLACRMLTRLDLQTFPPSLIFDPTVLNSELRIESFRIDHVGKLGGEVAQQVTRVARSVLDRQIEAQQEKITTQLNQGIAKHRDKLRISTARAAKLPWADQAKPHLTPDIQKSLD